MDIKLNKIKRFHAAQKVNLDDDFSCNLKVKYLINFSQKIQRKIIILAFSV